MASPKAKAPAKIRHNTDAPPIVQAAHIGLLVLTATKNNTWHDLTTDPASHTAVILTDEQQALLEEHRNILPWLQRRPLRTVLACTECDRFVFSDSAPAPARCTLTMGCNGVPVRATTTAAPDPNKPATAKGKK